MIGAGAAIEEGATVIGSVLLPGARVASRATVEGSIVGPGAIVGQRCVIHGLSVIGGGAVIASGTVLDGAAGTLRGSDRAHAGHRRRRVHRLDPGRPAAGRGSRGRRRRRPVDRLAGQPGRWPGPRPGISCTFHQLDIRSPEVVELMRAARPEVVFHLAAQADVRVSVADPVFDADVNLLGTLRVLEGARAGRNGPGGLRGQRRDALRRAGRVRAAR